MKIRHICGVLFLALATPIVVKAETPNDYSSYQFSCSYPANFDNVQNSECHSYPVADQNQNEIERRNRRSRATKEKIIQGYYGGINNGIFLSPDPLAGTIDLESGFGGSVFGGVKFPKNLSADAEVLFAFGGIDTTEAVSGAQVDGDYNTWGFFLNGRYDLPFSKNSKSSFFVSPGMGLIRSSQNAEVSFESSGVRAASNLDTSTTTFGFQLKTGAAFPIGKKITTFGQGRYMTNGLSTLSAEAGLIYSF